MCQKKSLPALAILFSHFLIPSPGLCGTPAICTYQPGVGPRPLIHIHIYIYINTYILAYI